MDGTKVPALDAHFELEAQYEKRSTVVHKASDERVIMGLKSYGSDGELRYAD